MNLIYLTEGARIFIRSLRVKLLGSKKYKGNAKQICRKIVKECFNGKYFQVSRGHFCEFYTRDFGWCVDSLLELGYKKEVMQTLQYALSIFSKHNKIAATISPSGIPFDFPRYSVDSLPYLMRSLAVSNNINLAKKHKDFLNKEIKRFCSIAINKKNGLVRKDRHFSSMKDHALRKSSCYDNIFVWILSDSLKKFPFLKNPLKRYDYKKLIFDKFWNGDYFLDDLSGKTYVAGDSNIMPFWSGLFDSEEMMKKAFKKIRKEGLDKPFPLKYGTLESKKQQKFTFYSYFVEDYETNTIWMHMGPLYVKLLKKINPALYKKHKKEYGKVILKYGNFFETFTNKKTPYKTLFYYSDESMLWAANFLTL